MKQIYLKKTSVWILSVSLYLILLNCNVKRINEDGPLSQDGPLIRLQQLNVLTAIYGTPPNNTGSLSLRIRSTSNSSTLTLVKVGFFDSATNGFRGGSSADVGPSTTNGNFNFVVLFGGINFLEGYQSQTRIGAVRITNVARNFQAQTDSSPVNPNWAGQIVSIPVQGQAGITVTVEKAVISSTVVP